MKKNSKKDSAVSPVIGTILLVAITVVLVAIISAVVMGMSDNVGHQYTVGVKVTNDADKTNVMFTGGEYSQIESWKITNTSGAAGPTNDTIPVIGTTYSGDKITGDCVMIGTFSTGDQTIWSGYLA